MLKTLISLSLVVLAAGLVALLAGIAPKFQSRASDMINFSQLYVSAAITVFIAFCFGAVRYSLAIGFGLALISLHDLLLTLALTASSRCRPVAPSSHRVPTSSTW